MTRCFRLFGRFGCAFFPAAFVFGVFIFDSPPFCHPFQGIFAAGIERPDFFEFQICRDGEAVVGYCSQKECVHVDKLSKVGHEVFDTLRRFFIFGAYL